MNILEKILRFPRMYWFLIYFFLIYLSNSLCFNLAFALGRHVFRDGKIENTRSFEGDVNVVLFSDDQYDDTWEQWDKGNNCYKFPVR